MKREISKQLEKRVRAYFEPKLNRELTLDEVIQYANSLAEFVQISGKIIHQNV